jgi:hypothetical protein
LRRVVRCTLEAFLAAALVLVSLAAAAESRIVQSGLSKPFPSIGDAVVGCRDPANTANWVEIITGKLWERTVQDGARQTLIPSLGDVATGVRGFFHAYIRKGECSGYEDGDEVTIEAKGRWYGIDMMCAREPNGNCYWIPVVDLRGSVEDYSAGQRR